MILQIQRFGYQPSAILDNDSRVDELMSVDEVERTI